MKDVMEIFEEELEKARQLREIGGGQSDLYIYLGIDFKETFSLTAKKEAMLRTIGRLIERRSAVSNR